MTLNLYTYVHNNPMKYVDPTGHIIQLVGTDQEKSEVLAQLQLLTNMELVMDGDGIVSTTVAVCPSGVHKGTQLVFDLIESDKTVRIKVLQGDSKTNVINKSEAVGGKGSDVDVYLNPNHTPEVLTQNIKTGKVERSSTPVFIVLGHELIHARSMVRGERIDPRTFVRYSFTNTNGKKVKHLEQLDELATVGLAKKKNYDITENDLRIENKLGIRLAYRNGVDL